jgi:signal transduction histidine kinase
MMIGTPVIGQIRRRTVRHPTSAEIRPGLEGDNVPSGVTARGSAENAGGATEPANRVDPSRSGVHEVLATVLHELRAPLSSLTVTVEVLANSFENLDPADTRALLVRMQRSTAWLQALVENLTVVAQLEVRSLPLRWATVDLAYCLEQARQIAQPSLDRGHQQVDASQLAGIRAAGDEHWIGQVLVNLLMNASKYGGDERTIEVGAEPVGEWVRVWVKDQGPGIPVDEQERIFGRYARGVAAQQSGNGGLGLGLHIVKTLVELHDGQVGVTSAPNAGATFWFTLQRVADEIAEPAIL